MRLGLGSAQFGMPYGVTNTAEAPNAAAVTEILEIARHGNVDLIDTAADYGNAERILGNLLPGDWPVRLVTKTTATGDGPITEGIAVRVYESALRSTDRLGHRPLHGLLIHRSKELLKSGSDRLTAVLQRLKEEGVVDKIGASVYGGEEIDSVLDLFTPDIIQLPYNLCDQRLADSGHLEKLDRAGVEIHVRSVFLQGILLATPEELPEYLVSLRPTLELLTDTYGDCAVSKIAACLSTAMRSPAIDTAIVGVASPEQMRDIVDAMQMVPAITTDSDRFRINQPDLLNPSTWPVP